MDDLIMREFQFADDPLDNFTSYIDRLLQGLSSRTERSYRATIQLLNEYINAGGESIRDIRVILSPSEAEYFRAEYVSLSGDPGLDYLITELMRLRDEILESEREERHDES